MTDTLRGARAFLSLAREDLQRVVGPLVVGKGFVPIGVLPEVRTDLPAARPPVRMSRRAIRCGRR